MYLKTMAIASASNAGDSEGRSCSQVYEMCVWNQCFCSAKNTEDLFAYEHAKVSLNGMTVTCWQLMNGTIQGNKQFWSGG